MPWDVFISHASEDKETVARPLRDLLSEAGLTVWLDEAELKVGDSLRTKIDEGLAHSRYGVVILSRAFFAKDWPIRELNGLAALETANRKVLLPVWNGVDRSVVAEHSPMLADKLAASTAIGLPAVASLIVKAIKPEQAMREPQPISAVVAAPKFPNFRAVSSNLRHNRLAFIAAILAPIGLSIPLYLIYSRPAVTGGHATVVDGYSDYEHSGFCFASGLLVAWNSDDADLLVSNQPSQLPFAQFFIPYSAPPFNTQPRDRKARGGIAELSAADFAQIAEAPTAGYQYHFFPAAPGRNYCIRTRDGSHYAKLHVTNVQKDRIEFDWTYQPSESRRLR